MKLLEIYVENEFSELLSFGFNEGKLLFFRRICDFVVFKKVRSSKDLWLFYRRFSKKSKGVHLPYGYSTERK